MTVETSLGAEVRDEAVDENVANQDVSASTSTPQRTIEEKEEVKSLSSTLPAYSKIQKKPNINKKPQYASNEALNSKDLKNGDEASDTVNKVQKPIPVIASQGKKPATKPKPHHISTENLNKEVETKDKSKEESSRDAGQITGGAIGAGDGGQRGTSKGSREQEEEYENLGIPVTALPKHIKRLKMAGTGFSEEYKV